MNIGDEVRIYGSGRRGTVARAHTHRHDHVLIRFTDRLSPYTECVHVNRLELAADEFGMEPLDTFAPSQ